MAGVPFLYVNVAAFCIYLICIVAFMAAKRTREVSAFLRLLGLMAIWSGATILMRLEIYPGLNFWFYVSLLALFSQPLGLYLFVSEFAHHFSLRSRIGWTLGTLILLGVAATGRFLQPPAMVMVGAGKRFYYTMTPWVAVPFIFSACQFAAIALILQKYVKKRGFRAPGILALELGCFFVALGNIAQILPGNSFPWDQASGIAFTVAMATALTRRRMFSLTLRVSKNVLNAATFLITLVVLWAMLDPIRELIAMICAGHPDMEDVALAAIFAALLSFFYHVLGRGIIALFNLDKVQESLLSAFSDKVTRSLSTCDIAQNLSAMVREFCKVEDVFVCLKDGASYQIKGASKSLYSKSFALSLGSPVIRALSQEDGCLIMDEFRRTTLYRSMWEEEKSLLRSLHIECIAALKEKDEIIGIICLAGGDRKKRYSANEVGFISTACSIAAIAIKNAILYEQMYREARIDSLTGIANYRAFKERSEELYARYGKECLALLEIDLDDFKLYNQLYGTLEGDEILKRIAHVLETSVAGSGEVFRTSGKIFQILLPMADDRKVREYTDEIRRRVTALNGSGERAAFRPLTFSAGICISPYGASSLSELLANADLAAFSAKESGKDRTIIRSCEVKKAQSHSERVRRIVEEKDPSFEKNLPVINALSAAIDAKDHYTNQHNANVARYASILASAIGLSNEEVRIIYHAGLLHDLGKISINESILGKTSALTDEEYEIMKGHVEGSIDMIRYLPAMDYLIPAVVGHHERWDGRGYPRGSRGEEIPLSSRCLAIADTFDAMTTDRPYRKGLPVEAAREEIRRQAGSQFDPALAKKFVELIDSGEIRLGSSGESEVRKNS